MIYLDSQNLEGIVVNNVIKMVKYFKYEPN